jgi:hypothetical protein
VKHPPFLLPLSLAKEEGPLTLPLSPARGDGPVFVAITIVPKVENEPIGRRKRQPMRSRGETMKALREELGMES